jgi:hypothetical protein
MASFHMEGEALIWFQDADESDQFPTWNAFVQAMLTRFGLVYDDPMEALMRLCQSSSVVDYTAQFEALSNRLCGIFEKNCLSCFLNGLKEDIRLPIRMLHPANLVAPLGLAKLQEEYLHSFLRPFCSSSSSFSMGRQQSWSYISAPPSQPLLPSPSSVTSPAKPNPGFPIQRISSGQMKEHREKGDKR